MISSVAAATRRQANDTKFAEGGNDEIRPVYRKSFAPRKIARTFAERACYENLANAHYYMEYPILEEPDHVRDY